MTDKERNEFRRMAAAMAMQGMTALGVNLDDKALAKGAVRRADALIVELERTDVSDEPDNEGWIPWAGGECPVDGETRVDVKFRWGGEIRDEPAVRFDQWNHASSDADIIAYRIAKR